MVGFVIVLGRIAAGLRARRMNVRVARACDEGLTTSYRRTRLPRCPGRGADELRRDGTSVRDGPRSPPGTLAGRPVREGPSAAEPCGDSAADAALPEVDVGLRDVALEPAVGERVAERPSSMVASNDPVATDETGPACLRGTAHRSGCDVLLPAVCGRVDSIAKTASAPDNVRDERSPVRLRASWPPLRWSAMG